MITDNLPPNHLIHEKSPYLLQHAHNPVEWYPWGREAIEAARREAKPILLSIGYSTCHWCHVMEKESFSKKSVAEIMNRHFINIKVDREERPDLDQIYITAVSVLTGSAGWPLNVFLTPELQPFHGGTYFPTEARFGIISWPELLKVIAGAWEHPDKRPRLIHSAGELTRVVAQALSLKTGDKLPDEAFLDRVYQDFRGTYDGERGGFSPAPKFPMPGVIDFLLFYHEFKSRNNPGHPEAAMALQMAVSSLRAMAGGGIYDQMGGGFHRYATDVDWHVPHFEKMLYDNAQMIQTGLEAFRLTGDEALLKTAEETIGYLLRDMQNPAGGFFSAEDADSLPDSRAADNDGSHSAKQEGAFYVWGADEIHGLLDPLDADMISFRYGVKAGGNVAADPHGEFSGKNILFIAHGLAETARRFSMPVEQIIERIASAKQKLLSARSRRRRPDRDDKIIASWNGLTISALAKAHQVTTKTEYVIAARDAAHFIMKNLYDPAERILYRIFPSRSKGPAGLASDYAFMVKALLDLAEVDKDQDWQKSAVQLNEDMLKQFWDGEGGGGFFLTSLSHDPHLILRIKEFQDSVIPSSNSIAAGNLFRIGRLTGDERYGRMAFKLMKTIMPRLADHPAAAPRLLMEYYTTRK